MADQSAMEQAVAQLGQLNGVALACQQTALSTRIRDTLIEKAPKTRDIGELFESATHAAYMSQGQTKKVCPSAKELAGSIESLKARFPAQQP